MKEKRYDPVAGIMWEEGVLQSIEGAIAYNVADPFTVALGTLPAGCTLVKAEVQVDTVFNAATTNVLTVGTVAAPDAYVAAGDVNEAATGLNTKILNTAIAAATPVVAKFTQTGGAATTGAAKIVLYYK